MRRRTLVPSFVAAVCGLVFVSAPCGGGTPAPRSFAAGALVIPMDNCYQRRDGTASFSTVNCNTTGDDGVFRAYGLVYFLLKKNFAVYWSIAPGKTSVTAADATVTSAASPVAKKWDWNALAFGSIGPTAQTSITYIGGPFIVDAADSAAVQTLIKTDPDFAPYRTQKLVDIQEVQAAFQVASARPLKGVPPRIAILDIGGAAASVMYDYAVLAGFDWPCSGADCAGGVAAPGACGCPATGATCNMGLGTLVRNGPGLVYDLLCDADFLPDLATSNLGRNGYKLLWAPHWDGAGTASACSSATCTGTLSADCALKCQLNTISAFVDTGNNLLSECHSIATLEGDDATCGRRKEPGWTATRFQSTAGMCWNGSGTLSLRDPSHPNTQIGDFVFASQGGSINSFFPEVASSAYRPGVQRLITETAAPHDWDILTINNKDNNLAKGVVVYFGGHSYAGQTAGTRIVLNSMFNLGLPCQAPNTPCNTGQQGECALGLLQCASSGGFECRPNKTPVAEACDGLDNDCNGLVDDCPPCPTGTQCVQGACATGCASCTCYSGPTGTAGVGVCKAGTQLCTSGTWSACQGEVKPSNEVCNGLDDDCANGVDDGVSRSCYDGPPGTETVAPCKPGSQTCSTGSWGACDGQVVPTPSAPCAPTCADGPTRACYDGPPATRGVGICTDGTQSCSVSTYGPCLGQVLPGQEVCNGKDDDCNTVVDNDAPCPTGYLCRNGICVLATCGGEIGTCPTGYECTAQGCAPMPCGTGGVCPAGQTCQSARCVDPCANVRCAVGSSCSGGVCIAGGCYATLCPIGKVCLNGNCVDDPCASATCPTGTFCRVGDCVQSCVYVRCAPGRICSPDGFCVTDCSPGCGAGQRCNNGTCEADPCAGLGCARGQVCREGTCVDDPCKATRCPVGSCVLGQCQGSLPNADGGATTTEDAGAGEADGGDTGVKPGCHCGTAGGGVASLLAVLAFLPRRRRVRCQPCAR